MSTLLLALAVIGIAACDSGSGPATSEPGTPANPPSVAAVQQSGPPSPYPDITIAPGDKVLVQPMSGIGDRRTPVFAVTEGKFTVRVACAGLGTTLRVGSGKDPDKDPDKTEVPCDEKPRRLHVATDETSASLQISADNATFWTVAVVVTDDFSRVLPSASHSDEAGA